MVWIGFLVFGSVLMLAAWWDSKRGISGRRLEKLIGVRGERDLLEEAEAAARAEATVAVLIRGLLRRVKAMLAPIIPAAALDDIGQRLAWAGMAGKLAPEEFYAAKIVAGALAAGIVLSLSVIGTGLAAVFLATVAGALGYALPDVWLNSRAAERRKKIDAGMITFVDMLAIASEAGLSLNDAVARVSEYQPGILGAEFARAFKEIEAGRPREDALLSLGQRNSSDDLRLLVMSLVQSGRTGTPVAQVLRDQAAQLRQIRRNRAQEVAQKSGIKILFPIMLFMFGPMMILLLGPAIFNLMQALGN